MKIKTNRISVLAISCAVVLCSAVIPSNISSAATTPSSKPATKVATSKAKAKAKSTKVSGKTTDLNIAPDLTVVGSSTSMSGGDAFKLKPVASASEIIKFYKLTRDCSTLTDPTVGAPVGVIGSSANDTLAACNFGDINTDGYAVYVMTAKDQVTKYNTAETLKAFKGFKSPFSSSAPQIYFTPSSRAIIVTYGGDYSFDANEVAWGVINDLGYNPPTR